AQTTKIYLLKQPIRELKDLKRLAADTQNMLKDALDSLAREDATLANNVIILDDLVSNMAHRLMRDLRIALKQGLYPASSIIDVILILRNLEKISHHALNIAGHTIWALTGQSAHSEDFADDSLDSFSTSFAPSTVPLDPL
ncbi:MAG: phosphate uptake regulator PhoU, partial [Pseudobdellovibrionaceae bacterium]